MPTPVAHTVAGACIAVLAARRLPAARTIPVAAAILIAANLPDVDYIALVRGRQVMEQMHQGLVHSIGFIAMGTLPLSLLLGGRLGIGRTWLLLAAAGLTHLLLDLAVVDRRPPVGFPFFWPLTEELFHSPVTIFPGIDRVNILSRRNLYELCAELAWSLAALPLFRGLPLRTPGKAAP